MDPLFTTATALTISLAIIPLMIRLAPQLRLLDHPNARKVHAQPTPRIGGWGISIGALAAVTIWQPLGAVPVGFLIGGAILLVAGVADDAFDLPGRIKLLLQVLTAIPVVIFANLAVDVLPLVHEINLPFAVGMPLSVLALITCINATNTSDGLDGLAAGATLLSLLGILYLAFVTDSQQVLLMTAAALGGLVGFLRYNTFPAMIFMGDLGSQFLGFAVGFLSLALLQSGADTVSPWAMLLVVGLPVADIAVVAVRRLVANVSIFKADKTHIHHRLLTVGFSHTQSVIAFYTAQASFVFFGVAMQNSEVWQIMLVYLLHLVIIYGFLYVAEAMTAEGTVKLPRAEDYVGESPEARIALLWAPRLVLETMVPLALVICAAVASRVSFDFAVLGAFLLVFMLLRLLITRLQSTAATRIPVYLTATAVLYLYTNNRPFDNGLTWLTESTVITILAAMSFVAVRFSPKRRKEEFRTTAMDYLLVVFAIMAIVALRTIPSAFNPYFLLYLPIFLYSCEFLLIERRQRINWLPPAAMVAAGIMTVRGLLAGG